MFGPAPSATSSALPNADPFFPGVTTGGLKTDRSLRPLAESVVVEAATLAVRYAQARLAEYRADRLAAVPPVTALTAAESVLYLGAVYDWATGQIVETTPEAVTSRDGQLTRQQWEARAAEKIGLILALAIADPAGQAAAVAGASATRMRVEIV